MLIGKTPELAKFIQVHDAPRQEECDKMKTRSVSSRAFPEQADPVTPGVGENNEFGIQERRFLIVLQRTIIQSDDLSASGGDHRVCGSRIPFGGRAEARIQVSLALGQQAEFQRTAHADQFVIAEWFEQVNQAGIGV